MLELRTLGQVAVLDASGALAGGAAAQRKPLALLALLGAAGEQGLTRERLAAYLWPELDEERSRQVLRQTLYSLRRDLGAPDLFLDVPTLRLNPGVIRSDVSELRAAAGRQNWARVVELRAGPFLDGFYLAGADEFERWGETERTRLEETYRKALDRLAADAEQAGDHAAAAVWWRHLVIADPLDSRSVVGLMRALEASGAPARALECAREHEARLREELGTGADPHVSRLALAIRGRMSAAPLPTRPGPAASGPPQGLEAPATRAHPDAEPSIPAEVSRPRRTLRTGAALAAAAAMIAVVGGTLTRAGGVATHPPTAVAIMPLDDTAAAWQPARLGIALALELERSLGGVASLRVAGPGRTAAFRDSTDRIAAVARSLRVGSAVEGTVTFVDAQVHLDVHLRAVPSGETLWSFRTVAPMEELPALQAELSRGIALRLKGALEKRERDRLERRPTKDPTAYFHYLRTAGLDPANRAENEAGITILQQAIRQDSSFALAYAVLARRFTHHGFLVSPAYHDSGMRVAQRALDLDPDLAHAHFAMGDLMLLARKPVTARFYYLKALELNPNELGAIADLAVASDISGRLDESLYWGMRAVAMDPASPDLHAHAGHPLCRLDADAAADRWAREGERRWPEHGRIQHLLMRQDLVGGRGAAALDRARRLVARAPGDQESHVALAHIAYLTGAEDAESILTAQYRHAPGTRPYGHGPETFRTTLAFLRLQRGDSASAFRLADTAVAAARRELDQGGEDPGTAFELAALSVMLGRTAEGLRWLDRAREMGWKDYRYTRLTPILAPLQHDPVFDSLLAAMKDETRVMRERAMATHDSIFAPARTASQ